MKIGIRDWGLRLGIKIMIFEFENWAIGIEDCGLGFGLDIGIRIGIADWDWRFG